MARLGKGAERLGMLWLLPLLFHLLVSPMFLLPAVLPKQQQLVHGRRVRRNVTKFARPAADNDKTEIQQERK